MKMIQGRRLAALALALLPAVAAPARAELPNGTITLVVPFAAGGATDVVGRLMAQELSKRVNRSVIVENVGGAGGTVGAGRVAKAEPDGLTLLLGTVATHAISPAIMKRKPYDPVGDFAPVSLVATVPNVLLVNNAVPAKSVAELVALIKAEPEKYDYGSSGIGTPPHLSGELFRARAGVDMVHVPFTGGGPAMTALLGGEIPVLFDVLTGAASHIRSGNVRALAVTTKDRSPAFPDLPTISESGVPGLEGYETYTWNAVFAPAGTPEAVVNELAEALAAAVKDPALNARLIELSATPVGSGPAELAALVKSEGAKWQDIITTAKLEMQ